MSTRRTLARISIFASAVGIVLVACSGTAESGERKKRDILLSETDDARIGREAAKSVPAQMGLYENPELEDYVNKLGQRLLRGVPRMGFDYQFKIVDQVLPKAVTVPAVDYDTAVQLVLDDEVDAMIADFPICQLSVLRHPEAGLSTLMTPFTIEPLGIALPADDSLFINLIDNYLNTIENTGLLVQFKAKWFSDGSWISELP